jgi:hypothetical protein
MKKIKKRPSFKVCPQCGFIWENRDSCLTDDRVKIIGYQARFEDLKAGLFLFNHSCNGTFALEAGLFTDLYDGPIFQKRETGSDDCPEYCLNKECLDLCPVQCECAFVREIIQVIKK